MIDDNVINEIVYAVSPYVKKEDVSDIRMRITIALSKYDIKKAVTDIVPYEGDVNEQIIMRFLVAKTAAGLSQRTLEEYKKSLTNILQRIGKPHIKSNISAWHICARTFFTENHRRAKARFHSP